MTNLKLLNNKIISSELILNKVKAWKKNNQKIVFTNGCFDIIHLGHIELLAKAGDLGDKLIIGINSDLSIKSLKGEERPVLDVKSRSMIIAALNFVDAVVVFEELTPLEIIKKIQPEIIVKGGDYDEDDVVGKNFISKYDGSVIILPLTKGFSTTSILNKIENE
jgi:D-glycero-beta-D-manno-heptose 1-phosphate adenylyltransferase